MYAEFSFISDISSSLNEASVKFFCLKLCLFITDRRVWLLSGL